MKYGSVCSGIEAATCAWHPLGWKPAWFSEIESFPSEILKYRFPDVPNLGDMTKLSDHKLYNDEPIDLLVGGTPCQSFSIAGLRGGLDDERGNLALEFCRILIKKQPQWFVWENVPGAFSSFTVDPESAANAIVRNKKDLAGGRGHAGGLGLFDGIEADSAGAIDRGGSDGGGKISGDGFIECDSIRDVEENSDFATILTGFRECGYSCAWRVLDAQYFGVPQRRRRVFVVGYLGDDWRPPYAVLLESESLSRDFEASAKERQKTARKITTDTRGAEQGAIDAVYPLNTMTMHGRPSDNGRMGDGIGDIDDPANALSKTHHHAVVVDVKNTVTHDAFNFEMYSGECKEISPCLQKDRVKDTLVYPSPCEHPLSFQQNADGEIRESDVVGTLNKNSNASGRNTPMITFRPPLTEEDIMGFKWHQGDKAGGIGYSNQSPTLTVDKQPAIHDAAVARRLTPLEAERLQGFPEFWTNIPGAKDGPRYAAIGNSMAVPVMHWIGSRIDKVDKILKKLKLQR